MARRARRTPRRWERRQCAASVRPARRMVRCVRPPSPMDRHRGTPETPRNLRRVRSPCHESLPLRALHPWRCRTQRRVHGMHGGCLSGRRGGRFAERAGVVDGRAVPLLGPGAWVVSGGSSRRSPTVPGQSITLDSLITRTSMGDPASVAGKQPGFADFVGQRLFCALHPIRTTMSQCLLLRRGCSFILAMARGNGECRGRVRDEGGSANVGAQDWF